MKNSKITNGNPLPDEVEINLNMLGSLMLNWVGGHVDRTDVITVDKYGAAKRSVKLVKKLTEPGSLSNTIGHGAILSFSTGTGDGVLTLGRPRDQVITKEHSIARGGLASIRTTSPVSIRVDHQIIQGRRPKVKTQVQGTPNVPKNALESSKVRLSRIMHVETDLLHGIGNVRSREGQILQSACKTAVI